MAKTYNDVTVIEMNKGEKIAYEQNGTRLILGDDEIMVNAEKYQKDWPVEVDVCRDKSGNLTIGTESGQRYVAQIQIPAATYTETVEGEGEETEVTRTKDAIDMADVTLVLWSIE